jgi:hypothetical protein
MSVNYHILANTVVVSFDGKIIKNEIKSKVGQKIIELIKEDKLDEIKKICNISQVILENSNKKFYVHDGTVYSYGEKVHPVIADKIIQFIDNDLPFDNLINFWNNLKENPSDVSQDDLYRFLEYNEFPLTPDGYFIAYKRVRHDFKDIHSGKFDNSIGKIVEMPREEVDDNNQQTCSTGLHIASYNYAKYEYVSSSNDIIVEVKVNPRDVVAVPHDYDNAKCRCCKYKVIGVIDQPIEELVVNDKKYEEPESTSDVGFSPVQISNNTRIGNYFYDGYAVNEDFFDDALNGDMFDCPIVKRKSSKYPKRIVEIADEAGLTIVSLYSTKYKKGKQVYFVVYTPISASLNDMDYFIVMYK